MKLIYWLSHWIWGETAYSPSSDFSVSSFLLNGAFQALCSLLLTVCVTWVQSSVCASWHSFIITTLPIYSSSHSASGPGQPLRLFMSQTVLLYDKTERLYLGLNVSFLLPLLTRRVPFAWSYCNFGNTCMWLNGKH